MDEFDSIVGVRVPPDDVLQSQISATVARQRKRWITTAILLCVLVPSIIVGGYCFLVKQTPEGKCWRADTTQCWDLSPEFISRVADLRLPAGTVVRDSRTTAWLSWSMSATVILPAGAHLPRQPEGSAAPITYAGESAGRLVYKVWYVADGGYHEGDDYGWPTPR